MKPTAVACLLLSDLGRKKSDLLKFLDLLAAVAPDFFPEKYGQHEPIATSFCRENLQEWQASPFFWKRRKGCRCGGSVFFKQPNRYTQVILEVNSLDFPIDSLVSFFRKAAITFDAHWGYIHAVAISAQENDEAGRLRYALEIGATEHMLKEGIPDVCWAAVYGRQYVDLIGRATLNSAPAYAVEEIAENHIFMQLTESWPCPAECNAMLSVRDRVRYHLGDFFWTRSE